MIGFVFEQNDDFGHHGSECFLDLTFRSISLTHGPPITACTRQAALPLAVAVNDLKRFLWTGTSQDDVYYCLSQPLVR